METMKARIQHLNGADITPIEQAAATVNISQFGADLETAINDLLSGALADKKVQNMTFGFLAIDSPQTGSEAIAAGATVIYSDPVVQWNGEDHEITSGEFGAQCAAKVFVCESADDLDEAIDGANAAREAFEQTIPDAVLVGFDLDFTTENGGADNYCISIIIYKA